MTTDGFACGALLPASTHVRTRREDSGPRSRDWVLHIRIRGAVALNEPDGRAGAGPADSSGASKPEALGEQASTEVHTCRTAPAASEEYFKDRRSTEKSVLTSPVKDPILKRKKAGAFLSRRRALNFPKVPET